VQSLDAQDWMGTKQSEEAGCATQHVHA
jgi:hypothetical protein